jgi:2-desacetyl-2-hydroxyethyl bacteriochlorophyllide A dehydrogenase
MQIKQVVVAAKDQVELQTRELSTKDLAPNELIIETERTFISAGTELAIYTAADATVYQKGGWCAYPWEAGYANVGVVLEAGESHRKLVGRRVFTNGVHASVHRYKTDPRFKMIAPVPEGLSLEEAVAARMAMVAMAGLDASTSRFARWVAVFGLGMVGNLAAQLFHLTGARVIGMDPSATRRRMAQECGIAHVLSGTEQEIAAEVKRLTAGAMVSVGVDAVGHSAICLQALRLVAAGGELVVLGTPRSEVQGNLTEVFAASHLRWITIRGALEWNVPTETAVEQGDSLQRRLDSIFAWLADGRLNLKPMITHVIPPEGIKTAYEGLLRDKENYVGVVLKWK